MAFIYEYSKVKNLILLLLHSLCPTQSTSTSGCNKTNFATSRSIPPNSRRLTDVLMVTTTEGMFNRLGKKNNQSQGQKVFQILKELN